MAEASLVSDLTSKDVGKRFRIQTNDGAYIEGTLITLTHTFVKNLVHVHVEFEELYITDEKGNQVYYPVRTWGNRTAVEVEDWPDK